jgi:hypothetical protein
MRLSQPVVSGYSVEGFAPPLAGASRFSGMWSLSDHRVGIAGDAAGDSGMSMVPACSMHGRLGLARDILSRHRSQHICLPVRSVSGIWIPTEMWPSG